MPPRNPERKTQLLAYVQENIQQLEAGEITRLPTYQELADRFGYRSTKSPYDLLKKFGIKLREYTPPYKLPAPSADLAWWLGIVSTGESVNFGYHGAVSLEDTHENILEKFKMIGERLFLLNAYKKNAEEESDKTSYRYKFYSVKTIGFLGDLGRDLWARTILSQHPWVIANSRYTWSFINGFFEKRGSIYTNERRNKGGHAIYISTPSQSGANLLTEMLVRQGLEDPSVLYVLQSKDAIIEGIEIQNLSDIRLFAQHIHSVVPEKEATLEYFRTR